MGARGRAPHVSAAGGHLRARAAWPGSQRDLLLGGRKLVEYKRLVLPCPTLEWLDQALAYPGIQLLALSPRIAAESTQLPGDFHKDPADQIIVATARALHSPLLTADEKIRNYPHVQLA